MQCASVRTEYKDYLVENAVTKYLEDGLETLEGVPPMEIANLLRVLGDNPLTINSIVEELGEACSSGDVERALAIKDALTDVAKAAAGCDLFLEDEEIRCRSHPLSERWKVPIALGSDWEPSDCLVSAASREERLILTDAWQLSPEEEWWQSG